MTCRQARSSVELRRFPGRPNPQPNRPRPADAGRSRRGEHQMSALRVAAITVQPLVLRRPRHARVVRRLRHCLEHVRDRRTMSRLQPSVALDVVSPMRRVVAARRLVCEDRQVSLAFRSTLMPSLGLRRELAVRSLAGCLAHRTPAGALYRAWVFRQHQRACSRTGADTPRPETDADSGRMRGC